MNADGLSVIMSDATEMTSSDSIFVLSVESHRIAYILSVGCLEGRSCGIEDTRIAERCSPLSHYRAAMMMYHEPLVTDTLE